MPARKHTRRPSQILLPAPLPVFSLVALPFSATGGGHAPSPLPPPSGRSVISASAGKKKKDAVASFFFLARCTEKDIVGKSFAIKALKPSGNFFTAFMWQKLKNRKSTTPTIVCPRIMLIEKLDPVQNVSFVVLSIKLGFLIPQPFPHRYPL